MTETTNNQPTNRTSLYIIVTKRRSIDLKNPKKSAKHCSTLAYWNKFKSEQYFDNKKEKEACFGVLFCQIFFSIIYIICKVVGWLFFCLLKIETPFQIFGGSFFD